MPPVVHEFTCEQLAYALGESRAQAGWLLTVAWHLATRLGGTLDTLRDGIITRGKAGLIVPAHPVPDRRRGRGGGGEGPGPGRAADPGGLRSALARAVMEAGRRKRGSGGRRRADGPGGAVGRGLRQRRPDGPRTAAR